MNWWKQTLTLLHVELSRERRRPELLATVALSTLGVALVFVFGGLVRLPQASSSMIWTTLTLAAVTAAGRLHRRKGEPGRIRLLLSGPVGGVPLFLSKAGIVFIFLLASGFLSTFLAWLFFHLPFTWGLWRHFVGMGLGALGLSFVSALMGSLMSKTSPDMLLAGLLMPLVFPLVIAGTKISGEMCNRGGSGDSFSVWLPFLLGFDVLFGVASLWLYETLLKK